MYPHEPVYEVMQRTMFNLKFIENKRSVEGPYEVTQLINSFLGALAHPWEKFKTELKTIPLSDSVSKGWPRVNAEFTKDTPPKNLGDLLKLLRNGFAHGNIEFLPNEQNEIRAIRIWNIDPPSGKRTWGTSLEVEDIRRFLERFVGLAEQLHQNNIGTDR